MYTVNEFENTHEQTNIMSKVGSPPPSWAFLQFVVFQRETDTDLIELISQFSSFFLAL